MRHLSNRPVRAAFVLLSSILLSAAPAAAQIYVDASATGANDGTSWANAFSDLQNALAVAVSGDEIWVAAGTYKPTTGTDQEATFQLKSGVGLYGGFSGADTSRAQRDSEANVATLSGDIGIEHDDCDYGWCDNSSHVVTGSGTDSTAVLDGFMVTRGGNQGSGGGMFNVGGSPKIMNVIFSQNGGWYFEAGGGMANFDGSNPILRNVIFSGNIAREGGGMYCYDSSPILTNVEFLGNRVDPGGGGGLYCYGSPILTNVTFQWNNADWYGGGMSCWGNPTLKNVRFFQNKVWNGSGGGMACGDSGTFVNVTFSDNFAGVGGGGLSSYGNPTLINVTFFANTAGQGGGMLSYDGNPILSNVVFWHNRAYNLEGPEIFYTSGTPTISYSLIEGSGGSGAGWDTSLGTDGGHNIDADPLFVDPTVCNRPCPTLPDLRLSLGSPAINAGNNAAIPLGVTTDLDGNPRIHCTVDMGAYESQFPDETPPTISVALSRDVLWPPNHKMSTITATVTPEDDCDPAPNFELVSIVSNEPDNGPGDGDTMNDIQGADIGTADVEFQLRSERSGQGSGRTYTITYAVMDESGNADTVEAFVRVPHDQSGRALAAGGFMPDGTGLVPGVETFVLVVPSIGQEPELSKLRGARSNTRAFVGNHLAQIPALSSQVLDVTGDHVDDLVFEYPAKATLDLAAQENEPIAFRYESGSGTGYLVSNIFALGVPIALPGRQGPPDELANVQAPQRTTLVNIRPNPFNPSTTVSFDLATAGTARIEIYDPRGTLVRTLRDQSLPVGRYEVTWDGRNTQGRAVSTGVYFVRLVTASVTETRKAILMK